MPTLPTLTVTADQFAKIVAAFPGATEAEKTAAYQAWLTNRLIERVEAMLTAQINTQRDADIAAMRATLPPRSAEPPFPTQ